MIVGVLLLIFAIFNTVDASKEKKDKLIFRICNY